MPRVAVNIDTKTGDIEFDIDGVVGSSCKDITDLLARGLEVKKEQYKPEYEMVEVVAEGVELE